jgi:hypothetical protein
MAFLGHLGPLEVWEGRGGFWEEGFYFGDARKLAGTIHGFGTLNALDMCWDGFRSARLLLYKKFLKLAFFFHVFNDDEADEILDS